MSEGLGMSKRHRDLLTSQRFFLVKNLILTETFRATMRFSRIINEEMEEEIMSMSTNIERNGKFLDILVKRGQSAYDQFIIALKESDQENIIKALEPHQNIDEPPVFKDPSIIVQEIETNQIKLVDDEYLNKSTPKSLLQRSSTVYPRGRDQKGRVVIINIKTFSVSTYREGSDIDFKNLKNMFKLMGYEISTLPEGGFHKKENIMKFIDDEKENMKRNGSQYYVWIMFIMSHGKENCFITSDEQEISVDGILDSFNGNNCIGLKDVPKLFFFQCCLGSSEAKGVQVYGKVNDDKVTSYKSDAATLVSLDVPKNLVHEKAHTFEAYCCITGNTSFRRADYGTWFICSVVYVFSRFSKHETLQSMFTKVKNLMTKFKTDRNSIQQAQEKSTLNMDLYLL